MSKRRTYMSDSVRDSIIPYTYYLDVLTEIAISSFEWENVPDTIDTRFLEQTLLYNGFALYFRDEPLGDLCLKGTLGGGFDVYDRPIIRRAYASNGYNIKLSNKDSVIVYNSLLHKESYTDLCMFAKKIAELDKTIGINTNAQKTPILVLATESQRLTMKNLYKQYEGGEPVIFGDKALSVDDIQVMKTDAPYVADKLYELKERYWNEALTYLGIDNVAEQKKERMLTDEVNKSAGVTVANRYSRLHARELACEEINRMFGTNISVKFRHEQFSDSDDNGKEGGADE